MRKIFFALFAMSCLIACNEEVVEGPTNPLGVPEAELKDALIKTQDQVYAYIPEEYANANTDIWVSKYAFPANTQVDWWRDDKDEKKLILTKDFVTWVIIVDTIPDYLIFGTHNYLFRFVSANDGKIVDEVIQTFPGLVYDSDENGTRLHELKNFTWYREKSPGIHSDVEN